MGPALRNGASGSADARANSDADADAAPMAGAGWWKEDQSGGNGNTPLCRIFLNRYHRSVDSEPALVGDYVRGVGSWEATACLVEAMRKRVRRWGRSPSPPRDLCGRRGQRRSWMTWRVRIPGETYGGVVHFCGVVLFYGTLLRVVCSQLFFRLSLLPADSFTTKLHFYSP